MLKYKVKSLIDAFREGEVKVIGHQTNCFNTMGAGVAPLIAELCPEVRGTDNATEPGDMNKLGNAHLVMTDYGAVYNLYGQYGMGAGLQTNYPALDLALWKMRWGIGAFGPSLKIGFPKLGCGLAGGSWELVSAMINRHFNDCDVTIYVLSEEEIPHDAIR